MNGWYYKMLDQVFKRQEIIKENINDGNSEELKFKPFITVSRDPGSGGKPIAELVAKKLGFQFYDKQLVDDIARSAESRNKIMADIDEKSRSLTDDFVHNLLNPEYITERHYIKHLCKVILTVARAGKVVILGRGSNFITPKAFGLQIRITAPYRVCVSRAVQYERIPYHKAREIIQKKTVERAEFVKQYFGKDITQAKYYDLTLNTTFMSLEDAADIIIEAFKRKFPRKI